MKLDTKSAPVPNVPVHNGPVAHIRIKALDIVENHDGTFDVVLPIREMTREESDFLKRLYPNLTEVAFRLLDKEAMFKSMEV